MDKVCEQLVYDRETQKANKHVKKFKLLGHGSACLETSDLGIPDRKIASLSPASETY